MELDIDQITKFLERKQAEIAVFWAEAKDYVTDAVALNTDLFENAVDDIKNALSDLQEESYSAGGNADEAEVDVEAEVRDVLDK